MANFFCHSLVSCGRTQTMSVFYCKYCRTAKKEIDVNYNVQRTERMFKTLPNRKSVLSTCPYPHRFGSKLDFVSPTVDKLVFT